jgi:hypothetical protein
MRWPPRVPVVVAFAAAATVLALGGCTRSGQGGPAAPRPTHDRSAAASPAESTAPSGHRPRLLVRTAGFRLPTAVGREAVVSSGCRAVVAGGLVGGDSSTARASQIDLRHGRAKALPGLPVPVHDTAGALLSRPLVIGGGNAAEQSAVQEWDGSRWRVVGHLPGPRSDLVAASVAGRLVVAGGYDGTRPAESQVLGTSDGRSWQVIGSLPDPVRYPAAAVARGALWLFGGETSGAMQTAIQRIDPTTGRARVVGRLPRPLGHAAALAFGRRILIAGGRVDAHTITDRLWWFDLDTSAVTPAGRLPGPLSDSAVARCADGYYLLGGETPSITDRILRVTDK